MFIFFNYYYYFPHPPHTHTLTEMNIISKYTCGGGVVCVWFSDYFFLNFFKIVYLQVEESI